MSENKFSHIIASEMCFVTCLDGETIEFHLVELTRGTDPDNPEIIGYGIWSQQGETGTLLARFDEHASRELCVSFMMLFNASVLENTSNAAALILDKMLGLSDPPTSLHLPTPATVEASSK